MVSGNVFAALEAESDGIPFFHFSIFHHCLTIVGLVEIFLSAWFMIYVQRQKRQEALCKQIG